MSNFDVGFASAFGSLVSGSILIGFIQHLKGGDLWISLAAAIPAIAGLIQIPGAIWGRSFPFFKKFIAPGGWAWRAFYFPFILMPLLPVIPELKLFAVIACVGMAAFSISIVNPIYNDWIAEMVPAANRGFFYSRRILIGTVSGAVTGFIGSMLLDYFRKIHMDAVGFTVIFTLAWALGLISMSFFLRMQDTPRLNPRPPNLKEGLRQLLLPGRDRNFLTLLIFTLVFAISQGYAGQFFTAYCREVLDLDFTFISLLGISHTIATIVMVKTWGFLCDRYGNKPILILLVSGAALTPLQWVFASPKNLAFVVPFLLVTHLFNGTVWSGIGVSQFNLYITTATPEDRPNYLAAATAVSAVALGVSPLMGFASMEFLRGVASPEWAYKWLFIILIGIRFIATLILVPVKEPGAHSLRHALGQLIRVRPKGVRALKKISQGSDEAAREQAIADVGSTRMELGREELFRALEDPSPKVRRQAARALAQIGGSEVSRGISAHLETHPEMADEELLEALGIAGGSEAVPILSRFLRDPRSVLRRAAASALGATGDPSAIEPLIGSAAEAGDTDLRRASLQALRQLEAPGAAGVIGDALWDQHPSVRTAAAEGVSEMELRELAPTLRESIKWFGDETASEMAYALGAVGEASDLPAILGTAKNMVSRPLRRRCLMGAARLLGVEQEFYRLIALDEAARDQVIMKALKPGIKIHPQWMEALDRYAAHEEAIATELLVNSLDSPDAMPLITCPVDESFLIAALYACKQVGEGDRA